MQLHMHTEQHEKFDWMNVCPNALYTSSHSIQYKAAASAENSSKKMHAE